MREISFRAWNKEEKFLDTAWSIDFEHRLVCHRAHNQSDLDDCVLMQYTGLKDKNGQGCCKVYEGDIITIEGKIRGNIYENEPRKTDIVIPPIGTKAWNTTYKKTLERGFDYAE